jgi:formylglycine-generating enzyme required for sulfatase activity
LTVSESHPKFAGLQQQCRKSLEALKVQAQGQGDLKTTMAAVAELERFLKAKSMPSEPDGADLPVIQSFQSDYVRQYNRLEQEMTAELATLTMKYGQALDRFQKELAKAGKLDAALAVQPELDKAQTALKGYAEQLDALKGAATNATGMATALLPTLKSADRKDLYLVVDLSRGPKADTYPVRFLAAEPKGGCGDEYKTDRLVLRRIEPGTFLMGSPENELGRQPNETQHQVTLKSAFYVGVFEVTQKQWERVTGDWPSLFQEDECRNVHPVERVTYNDVRGKAAGAGWPATNSVDEDSFMGKLRIKTSRTFDLPTEAQWEYACRAGTTNALNSGKNLTSADSCPNLSEVGRYKSYSKAVGTAVVGSFLPNAWGLYDMHGNVWELCLDWSEDYSVRKTDPTGATSGAQRVLRGGSWGNEPTLCRASVRYCQGPRYSGYTNGFRIALPTSQQ